MLSSFNLQKMLQYWGTPFITILYRCFLHREPDADGLRYYLGRLELGIDRLTIIEQLLKSLEAKKHFSQKELLILQFEIKQLKVQHTAGFLPIARLFSASLSRSQRVMLNRLSEVQYHVEHPTISQRSDFIKTTHIIKPRLSKQTNSTDLLIGLNPKEKKLFNKIYKQL